MKKHYIEPALEMIDLQPEEQLSACYKSNRTRLFNGKIAYGAQCRYYSRLGSWKGNRG